MFCATLKLPVETPDNPFVAPVTIEIIESFMNKVGYQDVVDKVSDFYMKNLAQPWQTMFKVFNRFLTTRTSGHGKFPKHPQRIDGDYHSIKDYIPLVSVYTTGNMLVRGMLIPDEFMTEEIHATNDFKEYETLFVGVDVPMNQPQLQQQQKQQEWDAWVEETVIDEDEYGNTGKKKYILSLHKIHTEHFPEVDLEEKMNRCVRKEFNTFNEDAQITEVVRKTTDQPHGLGFMEQIIVMRENDKLDSFSKADFKYLNKNDIEDLYYLYRNKLGIKSYQIKVNLTAPTLTFPGIEAHELYFIVDKPSTGLICLNSKDEKRVMYLTEIVKFCDATLEKVLKEVKLKIFQSEPWRKPPLLGELDCDILRAIERQITKRLSHI
ncbi:hypothetical protein Tco_0478081 [Tanacetum coccineum]